jgi:uncharacterized protein (UPF0335 family)
MPDGDVGGMVNRDALRGYVGRVENLHEQRDALNADIRQVYAEAKDAGFDTTTLREIVREMRMDGEARTARYAMLDQYRAALGMLADTPLGEAATRTVTEFPKPFAEQPVTPARRRGRPRKDAAASSNGDDPVARASDFRWQ